ncbi:hypothetical protein [Dyadobacter frigoris]|uniref:hypothetical protein n=1 Tax=Dyadobacter frigoris TaxID=2576211 RepID=UPI0014858B62|nr:hypothetical protein [Dyadobacter frigoris]
MSAKIVKIGKKATKEEKVANMSYETDYAASNIVRKTLEMAGTLKKYPRSVSLLALLLSLIFGFGFKTSFAELFYVSSFSMKSLTS